MIRCPLVTIITPCYNGAEFLSTFFDSILSQTYSNIELIFVDDGSTDDTADIAKKYQKDFEEKEIKFLYLYQKNAGQARAMNTAFPYMNGEYLVWPDSDDQLVPDSIEKKVEFLEKNPKYNMVRSNGVFYDYKTGKKIRCISNSENRFHEDIYLDLIMETTYCACGCYMIRTSEFRKIYPDLKIYESNAGQNWQILIPMAGRNKCAYLDEDQYYIAVRQGSHSRQIRTIEEQVERYLDLKNILLNGVNLAGRNDRNYIRIVEQKYDRLLMNYYLNQHQDEAAKRCYEKLKLSGDLTDADKRIFLKKYHCVRYQLYRIKSFVRRKIFKSIKGI